MFLSDVDKCRCGGEAVEMRVNLLAVLGSDIGLLGEIAAARILPGAARGEAVAMLVEGLLSYERLPAAEPRATGHSGRGYISAFIEGRWPLHKSWFVPSLGPDGYRLFLDPPRGLVRYVGRDDGRFLGILRAGLGELARYVERGTPPEHVVGADFSEEERLVARRLHELVDGLPEEEQVEILETLRQVDLLFEKDGQLYHVEVKTGLRFKPSKLRRKQMVLEARQKVLGALGLRPALVYITPGENWEVEVRLVEP
ncbi:MAG: hypothetical protein ACP5KY_07655 [Thermoproteus sp.]